MPDPLFLPISAAGLAVAIVTLVGLGYLLSVREKSTATWCLIGVMGGLALMTVHLFARDSWQGYLWTDATVWLEFVFAWLAPTVTLWSLVQFAYRFIDTTYPREARAVGCALGLLLAVPLGGWFVARATADTVWVQVTDGVAQLALVLCLAWTIAVLLRKRRRALRGDAPSPRAARAYLSYVLLVLVLAVAAGLAVLGLVIGLDLSGWGYLVVTLGQMAFIIGLVAVYLTHAPEPTTIQAKLTGLALVTTMGAVIGASVIAGDATRRPAWAGDLFPSQQTIRYEPRADGGYTVDRVPHVASTARGADLGLGDFGYKPVALGFAFPFGGAGWDTVYVSPNGALAFGARPLLAPQAPQAPPFADALYVLPLVADFNPEWGGSVRVDRRRGRATILWDEVPEFETGAPFTFRATLFESGAVEMGYDRVTLPHINGPSRVARGVVPGPIASGDRVPIARRYPVRVEPGAAYVEDLDLTYRLRVRPLAEGLVWLTLGAAAFVLLVFPLLFRGSLLDPLRRLLDGVHRVDEGDLSARVPVGVRDEFGRLAEGFNGMTASLREHTEHLEDLVAERTAELEAAQGRLVHAEKMASLGALTAGIAHEIKNPLNFVNNFAGLSREGVDDLRAALADGDSDEAAAILDDLALNAEKIEAHGKRADGIVRSMMEHARGGTGERRAIDLDTFVDEYVEIAWHGQRAKDPDAHAEIVRNYGAVGPVEVVPQELGRVLVNLLANAFDAVAERDAADADGYAPTVTVSTRAADGRAEVRVADNGPGIAESDPARVFEPFFTTKPTGQGTGLGLSMSYDIVTQGHGGTLTVESAPGEGAAFVMSLPTPAGPT